jgi:hypothetical protein
MAEASLLLFEFGSGTRANHGQATERMSGTLVKDMSTILADNATGACAEGTSEESPSRVMLCRSRCTDVQRRTPRRTPVAIVVVAASRI